jgi:uncharacterized protein YjbI with pentapeptide repeats
MANDEHGALLKQGVAAWNAWRKENWNVVPDLSEANLSGANLSGANLRRANLSRANLSRANLSGANLGWAHLSGADLRGARLMFEFARAANLSYANLIRADLSRANLSRAHLSGAKLSMAILSEANLRQANLSRANLSGANLREANLERAVLVNTNFTGADLTGCRVHGVSAWGLRLEGTKQQNLVVTPKNEPEITVDDIEVAQFIYLMLNNQKIRKVIDTITSKTVLILGRFTDERKAVLACSTSLFQPSGALPRLSPYSPAWPASLWPISRMPRASHRNSPSLYPTCRRFLCSRCFWKAALNTACSSISSATLGSWGLTGILPQSD